MIKALLFISIITEPQNPDSLFYGLDSVYFRYAPVLVESVYQGSLYQNQFWDTTEEEDRLEFNGFKNFSYDLVQGFDQGLKIDINGEVKGVRIEGNLSDKAVPTSTVPISEIEQMSIKIFTRNVSAGLGNLSLTLPFNLNDEIQGGQLGIHTQNKDNHINFAYAINRGEFKLKRFNGEEGKQSPYFLDASIIANSEKVYLSQGISRPILLKRGDDYTIDYEQGILSFTNNQIITRYSRIEVEYQKAIEDYPKIYEETDFRAGSDRIQTTGLFRRRYDDKMNPLTFELSPAEIESLKIVGDSSIIMHTYAESSDSGSYNLENDHFVYVGEGNGDYNVTFFYVGENNGDYVYDPQVKAFVYLGSGLGNYTPQKYLPLPGLDEFYGIGASLFNSLQLEFYGSRTDRNLFSDYDDEDNQSLGGEAKLSKKIGIFQLDGEILHYQDNFNKPQRKDEIDYQARWNTTEPVKEKGLLSLGIEPFKYLKLNGGYGIVNREHIRKFISCQPLFVKLYYEQVDTIKKYGLFLQKEVGPVQIDGGYEILPIARFINYRIGYNLKNGAGISLSGNIEDDTIRTGVTTKLNFFSPGLNILLGKRVYGDTTYYFGNTKLNFEYKGFNIIGSLEHSQRYSQKRDETFVRVGEGKGNYTYDPLTQSYIEKEGGEYAKRIILLPQFERVVTKNYAVEPGYSIAEFEINGRFNYIDEELFQKVLEEFTASLNSDIYDLELNLRQENSSDARYALSSVECKDRLAEFVPSYRRLSGTVRYEQKQEKYGNILKEERTVYESALSYALIEKPLFRPGAGYRQTRLISDYFQTTPLYHYTPYIDLLLEIPIKEDKGRLAFDTELLYRIYSQDEIPYFYSASEPPGMTETFRTTLNFSLGDNTTLSLIYSASHIPEERLRQNLRFQTMMRF